MTTVAKPAAKLGTGQIHEAIARRYSARGNGDAPRYLVAHEVRNGTGFSSDRAADMLVLKCWPSDGIGLLGFEVKTDRSDWLRELRSPQKAEAFAQFCDEWWVAAGGADVVQLEELPLGWGLLVPTPNGELRAVRTPAKNTPKPPPWPLVASFLRASQTQFEREGVNARVEKERESWTRQGEMRSAHAERRAKGAEDLIRAFETMSGIRLDGYDGGRIAETVRLLHELRADASTWNSIGGRLTSAARQLRQAADEADKAATEFSLITAVTVSHPEDPAR